ncbi:ROK family glucokinase [Thalassobacillus hwangdonensis]|uniref:Glucokinase n=1 Tax=Thalassobacillus hwangdonensis TaxID=546108 RepID=A0ABW3L037_9BACI
MHTDSFYIGVDIGGTTVKLAVVTPEGTIKDKWEIPTDLKNKGERIVHDIKQTIFEKIDRLEIPKTSVIGVGVGAPGFLDSISGFVYEAINLGWIDYSLGSDLEEMTGWPVFVENDANLAALGENWKGSGENSNDLLAVTLGTGVGGGVVANGELLNGANGTAGEIGHITVVPDGGAPCNCGKTGCLETVASATGIVRVAKEKLVDNQASSLNASVPLTAKDIFDAAAENDPVSEEVITYVTNVLGMSIANMANVLNPSKIVIGGGVSKAGDSLLIPLRKAFDKYALKRVREAATFEVAVLGNDAGVLGGAYMVKKRLENK